MSESISPALQPPVAVALAKLVKTFPGPDALPGVIYAEPKWDGYLHCTLSMSGPSAYCPSAALINSGLRAPICLITNDGYPILARRLQDIVTRIALATALPEFRRRSVTVQVRLLFAR